jgi:hypothetical protein
MTVSGSGMDSAVTFGSNRLSKANNQSCQSAVDRLSAEIATGSSDKESHRPMGQDVASASRSPPVYRPSDFSVLSAGVEAIYTARRHHRQAHDEDGMQVHETLRTHSQSIDDQNNAADDARETTEALAATPRFLAFICTWHTYAGPSVRLGVRHDVAKDDEHQSRHKVQNLFQRDDETPAPPYRKRPRLSRGSIH